MESFSWFSLLAGGAYLALIIGFALTIMFQRRPVGVSLAWLVLLFALPLAGIILFLMFGTRRLGTKRVKRAEALYPTYEQWSRHLKEVICLQDTTSPHRHNRVYNLAEKAMNIPALPGNHLTLYHDSDSIINGLLTDIHNATSSIYLEFYIWESGGRIDEIEAALLAAQTRGVHCLVLLDAVGSSSFLKSQAAKRLKKAGVRLSEAMPVGPFRMLFERMDIRNHRKIAVIDDAVAWSGSLNLMDPRLFKQNAGVGQWVDAMTRIEGPSAHVLASIILWDWELETGDGLSVFRSAYQPPQSIAMNLHRADMHVLPSGPGIDRTLLHQVLLAAIYESSEELVITTPYFIPDDALLTALVSAAIRGVKVKLIVPERNDSRLVHYASRYYYEELLEAGVEIQQFNAGLLHTKCVLVDRSTVLFGTVNLDMRSVWLNFEVTLMVYDDNFGQEMGKLADNYIRQSDRVFLDAWNRRGFPKRLAEGVFHLMSPLL
ncbi:MAG: cardiolipin synthase [Oceanospirillales bacterium LUC14_002_19_P2]|nr:MAG: cardiolipin synthase [Oceanospirillales bacterium LUC14_002_19_P2]